VQVNLILKMFGHVSIKEKRSELRFPVVMPLAYLELNSTQAGNGQTYDISRAGLSLATDREIPLGTQIQIILRMIGSDEMICEKGTVVWITRNSDDTLRIGIKLQEPKLKPVPMVLRTIMALAQAQSKKGSA
jgi:Tfp pilus assembly protein PilZ